VNSIPENRLVRRAKFVGCEVIKNTQLIICRKNEKTSEGRIGIGEGSVQEMKTILASIKGEKEGGGSFTPGARF